MLKFNPKVKLILADVDETLADVYMDATPEMAQALNKLLETGRHLFLISGGGLLSITERVVNKLAPHLRHLVLVGHCSGAEVWGFTEDGVIRTEPFYSMYDAIMNDQQKKDFRVCVAQLIKEFKLESHSTMPIKKFMAETNQDPYKIMFVDRGPQITLEMPNSVAVPDKDGKPVDWRDAIIARAVAIFKEKNVPVTPAKAGMFSIDFRLEGISKVTAIKYILENDMRNHGYDLDLTPGQEAIEIEIWGDRFSELANGDKYMCYALAKEVRAIDFRPEPQSELPVGYNIQIWDGTKTLPEGCLEYLNTEFKS